MSKEYQTIKEKGLALVEGKSVRVVGSLSNVFCDLLNEVYRDRQLKQKRDFVSFESNTDTSIIETLYNNISKEEDNIVFVSSPDHLDEDYIASIKQEIEAGDKKVHLITALKNTDHTLEEEKEEVNEIVQLEQYVLENNGRVYSVLMGSEQ